MPLPPDPFVENLLELLEPLGEVSSRRMFGGHGIYKGTLMFGLVAEGVFYLKADDENRPEFEKLDLPPFRFEMKNGKVAGMSYYECPDEAMTRSDMMKPWAESAYAAAERNYKPKKKRIRPPRK